MNINEKTQMVNVTITKTQYDWLKYCSNILHQPMTAIIRQAIWKEVQEIAENYNHDK